jgi:hypothetical protein
MPHAYELLQEGSTGVWQQDVIGGAILLTLDEALIVLEQLIGRSNNDTLIVPAAVNMHARLDEDWIRQRRRQRCKLVSIQRIPARQNGKSRAGRCVGEQPLIEKLQNARD